MAELSQREVVTIQMGHSVELACDPLEDLLLCDVPGDPGVDAAPLLRLLPPHRRALLACLVADVGAASKEMQLKELFLQGHM